MNRWLTTIPRNEDPVLGMVRKRYTPGAAVHIAEEYAQYRSGEYEVTPYEDTSGKSQHIARGCVDVLRALTKFVPRSCYT